MVGPQPKPTKAEQARFDLIKEQAWCIPCILNRTPNRPRTTIQHVVEGNKRLGHAMSYGCCGWHHLGQLEGRAGRFEMMKILGPSLVHGSKEYREVWGPERILIQLQDFLIDLFEKRYWDQYNMPRMINNEVIREWERLRGLR